MKKGLVILLLLIAAVSYGQTQELKFGFPNPDNHNVIYSATYWMAPDSSIWKFTVKNNGTFQSVKVAIHPDSISVISDSVLTGGKIHKRKKK